MKYYPLHNLLYALIIAGIYLLSDAIYSLNNQYFIFQITSNEYFRKLFPLVFFISFVPKKRLRVLLHSIIIFFSLIQFMHFSFYGKNVHGIEVYLFCENLFETFETLGSVWSSMLLPLFISVISLISILTIEQVFNQKLINFKYTFHIFLMSILSMNIYVYTLSNIQESHITHFHTKWMYPMTNRQSARNIFISLNYFLFAILPHKLSSSHKIYPTTKIPKCINQIPDRNIILIIGESLRYDKFMLQNNPLTQKLKSFAKNHTLYFKKIFSGGTSTKVSIATLIHGIQYPNSSEQIIKESTCLFKLAKKNKFHTSFISSQANNRLKMIRDILCPKYIDNFLTRDDFTHYMHPTGYDEDLTSILKALKIPQQNDLVVLEHRGSHSPYVNKYPPKFNISSPYDNTVRYTDASLSKLFSFINFKLNKKEFFIFYVSDHGELLGEHGKHGHGQFEKEVYTVPLLMYTNTSHKDILEQFKYIQNHYELSQYLLMLLGYDTNISNRDRTLHILNTDIDGYSGHGSFDIHHNIAPKALYLEH